MRFVFALSLILLLISCNNIKNDILPEIIVEPKLVSDELIMHPPLQMLNMKDYLVFVTPGMEQSLLFYKKKNQKTFTWGKPGNGPDDFISASLIECKDGKVKLFDSNLRKCVEYGLQLQDTVKLDRMQDLNFDIDSITLLNLHAMDNGMTIGFAGFGSKYLFVLLNNKLKVIKTFGEVPIKEMPEENNLQLYGWFSSYKNKLFFASQQMGYIVCFTIDNQNNVVKEWEKTLMEPLYDSDSQKWKKENRYGFFDIVANDKYIFTAFSGKNLLDKNLLPQNILVFTHKGEMLKNVKCKDTFFGKIAVSDDGKIYTFGEDQLKICDWSDWEL